MQARAAERLLDRGVTETAHGAEGLVARLVAAERHDQRREVAVGGDAEVAAAAEGAVGRDPRPQAGNRGTCAGRGHVALDRDEDRRRARAREALRQRLVARLALE